MNTQKSPYQLTYREVYEKISIKEKLQEMNMNKNQDDPNNFMIELKQNIERNAEVDLLSIDFHLDTKSL